METWQELKVTVKREGEELVSNLLIELGAQGVAIEDSMDYVGNVDRFGEIFPEVEQQEEIVVTAYYPDTVDVTVVEADLQARISELTDFMDLGELKIGTTALAEEDWADNWKKYYEPARITHDLTIVPSWTDYEATAGEKIIKLDPGMENIHVAAGDLLKGVEIEADVIVANILADILIHLIDDAYRLVKDEGYLIMSGIIKDKWDMVRQSAESAGFFLETHMVQGEWNTCVFKKTKDISGVIGG
ncbi:TPA: 50S ribosomal protein L11 methyltransferase [Streptococcus pneumoniae]|nr:50S ribosomal protein L11 methyltransferase [Streptococcus pneumoniae]HEW5347084.1 50S ribosomal protein L11 methyltransferase [Streptococcus pneumoniae]